jgi:two-component system phosphate regulon sensor histidine kinase PhoR
VTELQRADAVRREFVANVSHELRTPVAALKAMAETLASGALDDPPAARSFVDRIELEADRLAQLVEELLELARLEGGRAFVEGERVDVAAVVTRAAERVRPLADRRAVALKVEPGASAEVLGDAARLERAVVNLVDNAVKFTPPAGGVTVREWQDNGEVLVSVADTGPGIAAEDQARVFERFYKADRARATGGAGLGLAIAKHTVLAMGGRIWVESTEGKGATFVIALPRSVRSS